MQRNDQIRFYTGSDPTHKENLSGRVSAACLNCRRKKIKCSGSQDCDQCLEKGLVCEGPPSRKRLKRDDDGGPSTAEATFVDEASAGVSTNPKRVSNAQRAMAVLKPSETADSGYESLRTHSSDAVQLSAAIRRASEGRGNVDEAGPSVLSPLLYSHQTALASGGLLTGQSPSSDQAALAFGSTTTPYTRSHSPGPVATEDWNFLPRGHHLLHGYSTGGTSEASYGTHSAPGTASATSADWPDRRASEDWWAGDLVSSQSPAELLSAAETLEQQAQALRAQALRRIASSNQSQFARAVHPMATQQVVNSPTASTQYNVQSARPIADINDGNVYSANETLSNGLTSDIADFATPWTVVPGMQQTLQPIVQPTAQSFGQHTHPTRQQRLTGEEEKNPGNTKRAAPRR